jgi:hypothetical protein
VRALIVVVSCAGCALTMRLHAAPTVDRRGLGFEAGVSLGLGPFVHQHQLAPDPGRQYVLFVLGDISAQTPGRNPRFGVAVDYERQLIDGARTWRVGFAADAAGDTNDGSLRLEMRGAYLFHLNALVTVGPEVGAGAMELNPGNVGTPSLHAGGTLDLVLPLFVPQVY